MGGLTVGGGATPNAATAGAGRITCRPGAGASAGATPTSVIGRQRSHELQQEAGASSGAAA